VMAAYNSVNGAFMTANRALLHDLLKTEWGFQGVVVSDWSATYSTVPSAHAGLDLIMPGPLGPWGDQLVAEVRAGAVAEAEIDDKVARLITLARRVGAINGSPQGNSHHHSPADGPRLVDPMLVRQITTRSFVLLSNPHRLLPIKAGSLSRLALIGPNAVEPQTQGGGSVRVLPVAGTVLAHALGDALDTMVSVHQGCETAPMVALPPHGTLHDPVSGKPGVRVEVRAADGAVVHDAPFHTSVLTWWDDLPAAVHRPGAEIVMRASYRAHVDGPHVLGAAGVGLVRLLVDGKLLAENKTEPAGDAVHALSSPPEARVVMDLRAGREIDVTLEHRPNARGAESGFASVRLGIAPQLNEDELIADAVVAAAGADVAVVVVGSAEGTESEGYDRENMALPGRQDELVRRVVGANPNTVVVINSGMPVLMPWADEVAAIIQVWLPGQAFADALSDVISGVAEPGGRLPVSVPRSEADSPVLFARPVANNLVYAEGLLVGYRGYDRKGTEPLFCFGHGLGYTEWTYESITCEPGSIAAGEDLSIRVAVRNSGKRPGREVVQVYLEGPDDDPRRPIRIMGGFAGVDAEPGTTATAEITVAARTFARFDEARREWVWPAGTYTIRAGKSSRDLGLSAKVVMR
jgi:beta-glucosidase